MSQLFTVKATARPEAGQAKPCITLGGGPLMDAERWRRIHGVFEAAMMRSDGERPSFLHKVCLGDDALRREVEQLLDAHARAATFLEAPAFSDGLRVLATEGHVGAYRAGADFGGTERYTVRRRLGAGGMGIVYEVHDRVRDEIVALKTLLRASAADIYRLKREFRSLADVAHTNLVSLYELIVEDEHCFFTMELVNGVNFVEYVCGASPHAACSGGQAERIRAALRQLVDGLSALHRKGKLHRDIKPSNVLVTPDGRVVILDFGLISDVLPNNVEDIASLAGTPAYIAPEQGPGAIPSEANDWYSVGVTLYETLIGRVPFEGTPHEVLSRKREVDPPPLSEIAPHIPDDLAAICMGLLCRDPARRWSGVDVLRRLAGDDGVASAFASLPRRRASPFVGRERQLDVLNRAFLGASHGRAGVVCIHGTSGIGKSALAQRFLDHVLERKDVVVLRGRCYEHESVPYKALDGVIDSLSEYLGTLDRRQIAPLVPRDLPALSRLFPVMLQMHAAPPRPEPEIPDPLVFRQRAFLSLRELLTRIADRQPLVLYIDDLHWADADSVLLLEELLRPPQPPPLLTLACFRTEEIASKPFLQRLLDRDSTSCMVLPLGPMPEEEAHQLVASLASGDAPISEDTRNAIVTDAAGNPFLLEQLAGYIIATDAGPDRRATFAQMLAARLAALPAGARRFLETLAVCGRPVAPQVVHEASGLAGDERPLVALLRSDRLLRSSGSAQQIEIYHDRIRDALAARISADDERHIHAQLARTLVARGADDPEALFAHFHGAGDQVQASIQAALAARKADAALAFDRAASFYRSALELAPHASARSEWTVGLAAALANAGRPTEAANVYLEAAGNSEATRRIELQRRAAEQMLIGGHIDRGLDVIRAVLKELGLGLATSSWRAIASLVIRRARLRWRGLDFVEREAARIPPEDLFRIDTCWSLSTGLALVDNVLAADFHTQHLLLALDAGEPHRIASGLALEAGFSSVAGGPAMQRTAALVARARVMAERLHDARAIARCTLTEGMAAYLAGQWRTAAALCERAQVLLRDECVGVTWELNVDQNVLLAAILYQGELREVSRRLPTILSAAREHGNLYIETELRTRMILTWLAADDPEGGEQQAADIMSQWSHRGFHRQHHNYLLTRIQTALYRGRAEQAWQLIAENWTAVERSHVLRIQWMRIEAAYVRARCALLMAAGGREPRRFLSVARADSRRIARENMPWSNPIAALVGAGVAHLEGNVARAGNQLADAIDGFERADMKMYAAVARRRLGALHGGDRDGEMLRQSGEWFAAQGIKNPASMARLIAPGLPDVTSTGADRARPWPAPSRAPRSPSTR